MRKTLGLTVAMVMLSAAAFAQENAVVYMDARTPLGVSPAVETPPDSFHPTPDSIHPRESFLVQGAQNEFVVQHRKFLTEYSINIDGITKLQNFRVEDLEEAANLTTPLSSAFAPAAKGAAPKGVATTGNLPQRTAQQFLAEMFDPATKAGPITELNSDWLVLAREAEKVKAEDKAFTQVRDQLLGISPTPFPVPVPVPGGTTGRVRERRSDASTNCSSVAARPSLEGAVECLHSVYLLEYSDAFPPRQKYGNEDAFRDLIVTDNDAIAMVNNLGTVLSTQIQNVTSALNNFESDLAQYRADLNVFAGNMQSLEDAHALFERLGGYTKLIEIRARLAQSLNPSGTTAVDAAELNKLAEEYYAAAGGANFQPPAGLGGMFTTFEANLWNLLDDTFDGRVPREQNREKSCCEVEKVANPAIALAVDASQRIGERYAPELDLANDAVYVKLPTRINEVNILQSQVLSRANEIYDNSCVEKPVRKQFNLGGQGGNLQVYFTVRMVETFPRFAVPPVSAQAPAAASALPPPASASTTKPATQASGSAAAPDGSSGVIVAHGKIEVHDLYHATMVAAFGFSGAGETTFTSTTVNTGTASDGTSCSSDAPCTKITVSRGANHSSALVAFSYHPAGYDTFPHPNQSFKHLWGIMGGLSLQNLNDYYAGLDVQIVHAIQVMGGANFYRQKALSPGYTNGGIYPGTPTFDGAQHWTTGAFGGIGLNLSIFRKAFGSVTGIGVGAPSKGN